MTEQEANKQVAEARRQILLFGTTCTYGCATSYAYIHKSKKYCLPHWYAVRHVNK